MTMAGVRWWATGLLGVHLSGPAAEVSRPTHAPPESDAQFAPTHQVDKLAGYENLPEGRTVPRGRLGPVGPYWLRRAVSAKCAPPVGVRTEWLLPRMLSPTPSRQSIESAALHRHYAATAKKYLHTDCIRQALHTEKRTHDQLS